MVPVDRTGVVYVVPVSSTVVLVWELYHLNMGLVIADPTAVNEAVKLAWLPLQTVVPLAVNISAVAEGRTVIVTTLEWLLP